MPVITQNLGNKRDTVLNSLGAFAPYYRPVLSRSLVTSSVWPSANSCIFVPFELDRPQKVTTAWWVNGNLVNGNVDVGVYNADGVRLMSIGSTVMAGTNQYQTAALALTLPRGALYLAFASSSASAQFFCLTGSNLSSDFNGIALGQATFPLPSTATFAAYAVGGKMPYFGVTGRTF